MLGCMKAKMNESATQCTHELEANLSQNGYVKITLMESNTSTYTKKTGQICEQYRSELYSNIQLLFTFDKTEIVDINVNNLPPTAQNFTDEMSENRSKINDKEDKYLLILDKSEEYDPRDIYMHEYRPRSRRL